MMLGCKAQLKSASLHTLPLLGHAQRGQTHTGVMVFTRVDVVDARNLRKLVQDVFWSVLYTDYVSELMVQLGKDPIHV